MNKVFALPVITVESTDMKPPREIVKPNLQYTQDEFGTCDISTLSSAFYCMCDQDLKELIFSKKGYMKSLIEPIVGKNRKSYSMKFLINIINRKQFSNFYVQQK